MRPSHLRRLRTFRCAGGVRPALLGFFFAFSSAGFAAAPGTISTVVGAETVLPACTGVTTGIPYPSDVAVDSQGNLYIVRGFPNIPKVIAPEGCWQTEGVYKLSPGGTPQLIAGGVKGPTLKSGDFPFAIFYGNHVPAPQAPMNPHSVEVDTSGNLYLTDTGAYRVVRMATDGMLTSLAGLGWEQFTFARRIHNLPFYGNRSHPETDDPTSFRKELLLLLGDQKATPAAKMILHPNGLVIDPSGNLFVSDRFVNVVYKITPQGFISVLAGQIADPDPADGSYDGDGGPAIQANLNRPAGLALDPAGNLYIADTENHCIRKVNTQGIITTFAGLGGVGGNSGNGGPAAQAKLAYPADVAVDAAGTVFIADTANHEIRKVTPDGIVTSIAGTGSSGFSGDGGPATEAQLNAPESITVGLQGELYIADTMNHRVRKIEGAAAPTPVRGSPNVPIEEPPTLAFRFDHFSPDSALWLFQDAVLLDGRIRLTTHEEPRSGLGVIYLPHKLSVQKGFETTFQFQVSPVSPLYRGLIGDGMAMVIHNSNAGLLGGFGGALGYSNESPSADRGIPNALAIELDMWKDDPLNDPNDNHVSIHPTRSGPVNADEIKSLGSSVNVPAMKDGSIHTFKVTYVPGTLSVFVDELTTPALKVSLDLSTALYLDQGSAWIGLTASTGFDGVGFFDVLSWSFTSSPDGPPSAIPGDLDKNGRVNVSDAILLLKYIVGIQRPTLPPDRLSVYDITGDRVINILDGQSLLRQIASVNPP